MDSEEVRSPRGRRVSKSAGEVGSTLELTASLAAAVAAKNRRAAEIEKKNGKNVVFSLIDVDKAPFKYITPKAKVYIPEDWESIPYLSKIVEKNKAGEYITGVQEIRYVAGLNSIFVENQPEKVRIETIIMPKVRSLNEYRDKPLINFLRLTSLNKTNPHKYDSSVTPIFEELNESLETEVSFDAEYARHKMRSLVIDSEDESLWGIANVLGVSTDNPKVMRQQLLRKIEAEPARFNYIANHPELPIMERFAVAKELGHIEVSGRKVSWTKDKSLITMLPPDADWLEYMLEFAKTPAGEETISIIDALFRV